MANILRKHLPDRKDPRLVGCLAILGSIAEARELLRSYLNGSDVRDQIDAAGELCTLGEQQTGNRCLRKIVRRTDLPPHLRIAAASTLERAGLLRPAAFAFARIANDEALGIQWRARAAISFDKLLHDRNNLVWHSLMRALKDKGRSIADRVEAGEALLTIDGEDGYDDLVYPLMASILDEGITDDDALVVGESLGLRGRRLKRMPRVLCALTSPEAGLSARTDAMRALNLHDRNPEVKPLLRVVASSPDTPAKYAIKAAGILAPAARGHEILKCLAADATLSPAWRLAAIRERRPHMPPRDLLRIARDQSVSIGTG